MSRRRSDARAAPGLSPASRSRGGQQRHFLASVELGNELTGGAGTTWVESTRYRHSPSSACDEAHLASSAECGA